MSCDCGTLFKNILTFYKTDTLNSIFSKLSRLNFNLYQVNGTLYLV